MSATPHRPLNQSLSRSLAKAVSWRVLGSLDTFILSFLVLKFGSTFLPFDMAASTSVLAGTAAAIAVTEVITKIIIYATHEQIWTRVLWGHTLMNGKAQESKRRSIAKTATWRVTATLDTMALAWFFTGSAAAAMTIGSLETLTKLGLYYAHERLWNRIPVNRRSNLSNLSAASALNH